MNQRVIKPGERIGRWTIVREATPGHDGTKYRKRYWAKCSCGTEGYLFRTAILANRVAGCHKCARKSPSSPSSSSKR
jgi:hypothetical protein